MLQTFIHASSAASQGLLLEAAVEPVRAWAASAAAVPAAALVATAACVQGPPEPLMDADTAKEGRCRAALSAVQVSMPITATATASQAEPKRKERCWLCNGSVAL